MDGPRPINEIVREAIRVLSKEMGVADTARFIDHLTGGYGNYTEERQQLFSGMTLDDIVSEIKQMGSK